MIKRTLLSAFPLIFLFLAISCQQKDKNENEEGVSADLVSNPISAEGDNEKVKLPVMEFEKNVHDFGMIVKGEKVAYNFKFTNAFFSILP